MTLESLEAYRALPYQRVWGTCEEEGCRYFTVHLAEIPCVIGGGETKGAALRAMNEAFDDYVEWRLAEDLPIALPRRVLPREPIKSVTITLRAVTRTRDLPYRPAEPLQFKT